METTLDRRTILGTGTAIIIVALLVVLIFSGGGEPEPVGENRTAHTTVYSDGTVAVNNSQAVEGYGSALLEKDMSIDTEFEGVDIEREYEWLGVWGRVVIPAYRPLTRNDERIFEVSRRMDPSDGVPEVYAGVSLEKDSDGEGFVEARLYFDEEFRNVETSRDPSARWGKELSNSKPIDWTNEVHPGVYMVTVRDYNLSRHRTGRAFEIPYVVAGYVTTGSPSYTSGVRIRGKGVMVR